MKATLEKTWLQVGFTGCLAIHLNGAIQGGLYVSRHLKCPICGELVHVNTKFFIKFQILIGNIPTFSENLIQISCILWQSGHSTR